MTRISAIMAAYNAIRTVGKAIGSLQDQMFTDWEIVAVDDCSTDGTYEFLQAAAAKDCRIKLFRTNQNLGQAVAGKMAIEEATGEWITILDADDWYSPGRLEALHKWATLLKADMVIDNLLIFDHALGKVVTQTNYGVKDAVTELTADDLFRLDNPLQRNAIGYCKPFVRTSFLRQHNINYWGKYRTNEDFTLLSEIVLCGAKALIVPGAYYVYVHRISPTTRKVSPSSHMPDDTGLVVAETCDTLLEKYAPMMSAKARRELVRRKKIFLTSSVAWKQTALVKQGQFNKALELFFKHPSLFGYRAIGIGNRLRKALRIAV